MFRNNARNAGRSRKNAGNKPKCGISRTIAGQLNLCFYELILLDRLHYGELFPMYQSGAKRTCLILVILRQLHAVTPHPGRVPHYSDGL